MRTVLHAFHILLPALLGPALTVELVRSWQCDWYGPGLLALICGTLVAYTGDRMVERGDQLRPALRIALAIIGGCAAVCLAALTLRYYERLLEPICYLSAIAIAYPALKRIPVAKAIAVGVCWMIAICTLPMLHGTPPWFLLMRPAAWAVCALIIAGTILCDFKDQLTDRQAHIPSFPVWLGERWARLIAAALCLHAIVVAAWDNAYGLWLPAGCLLLLMTRTELLRRILWGPIAVDAALCSAVLITWLL